MDASCSSYSFDTVSAAHETLAAVAQRFRTRREQRPRFSSTYYDTFDWRLYRAGLVLRVLPGDSGDLLSVEQPDGTVRRRQRLEQPPGFADDLPPGPLRDTLAPLLEMRRLLPLVRLERRATVLRVLDDAEKTVARVELGDGRAAAPENGAKFRSLDPALCVRAVRGYPAAEREVTAFVSSLAGLRPDRSGELELALATLGRRPGDYTSKLRLALEADQRADEAAKTVLRALLAAMQVNEAGVRADLDSEFLHDFRVACRRTRSCLTQVKEVFPADVVERFRPRFSWLGQVTGPTRDLDVYLLKLDDYGADLPEQARCDLQPLEAFLRRHQRREQSKLARALTSKRCRDLFAAWSRFLDEPLPETPVAANAARPAGDVARERIGRAFSRVLRKGGGLDAASPANKFHRLRIDCKKLRYLLEFFRSLYAADEVEPLIRSLKKLQDNLGDFNDLTVQQETLRRFAGEMLNERSATAEALLAMGRLVERLGLRQVKERERFAALFAEFAGAGNRRHVRRMLGTGAKT